MASVPLALNPGLTIKPHPGHMEPFLAKVADLVCSVFGDDCARDFKWAPSGRTGYYVLMGSLDSLYHIKITITQDASVVIFYKQDVTKEARPPVEELDRSVLRNESWSDFQGWVFKVKTEYDQIAQGIVTFEVVKAFGVFDEPSQASVRFRRGERAEVSGDRKRIRLASGANRGPWIYPSKDDKISNIPRMIRMGCLRAIK